ncbi:GHKL domain-containing protein [Listeria booriae]|uniref:GHKL domain-containing protein n=1 Tax=Listeria booriae TaxID=1552123 RepID=UPI00164E49DF|nr:GHKL domain-containing protein [Listeria booriae]MBC6135881.1 GHKL domain-containing protein [Listeria booriae]
MTYVEVTLFLTMNYLIILWVVGKRFFFSGKQLIWLTVALGINVGIALIFNIRAFHSLFLVIYLLQWLFSSAYSKSHLLAILYLLIQYNLSIVVFYLTYDLPLQMNFHGTSSILPFLFLLQMVLLFLLSFFVIFIFKKYDLKNKIYFLKSDLLYVNFLIFLLFIGLAIRHTFIVNSQSNMQYRSVIPIVIFTVFLALIALFLFANLIFKLHKQTLDNKLLRETLLAEQNLFEFSREFQHDLGAILLGLEGYLAENQVEEARIFLKKIQNQTLSQFNKQHLTQIDYMYNLPIKAVLYEFSSTCIEKKIPLNLNITADFREPPIDLLDYLRCISIMLNNAVEARFDNHFFITVDILKKANSLEFIVKNPVPENFKLQTIFKKGFSTKQNHKGLGLSNLRKIVTRHSNLELNYSVTNKTILVNLKVSLKNQQNVTSSNQ